MKIFNRFSLAKHGNYDDIIFPNIFSFDEGDNLTYKDGGVYLNEKLLYEKKRFYPLELEHLNEEKYIKNEDLYILPHCVERLRNPKRFVDYITEFREEYGFLSLMYMPGSVLPYQMPTLVYIGLDFFDCSSAYIYARKGYKFTSFGLVKADNPLEENIAFLKKTMNETISALEHGKLREFSESFSDITSKNLLRYADLKYYRFFERFYPIWNDKLYAINFESLFRPDVERFRERIKNRYEKPKSGKVLLLLPCSAKKPYSLSNTHRKYQEEIKKTQNPHVIHQVVITSPLGLVPMELERFYPAQNYDIPVIGHWYEEEKKMINETLKEFLTKHKYEKIVVSLPEDMCFINDVLDEYSPAYSQEFSWKDLEFVKDFEKVSFKNKLKEDFSSISKFQFGMDLLENVEIKGRYPYHNIFKNGKHFLFYNPNKGMFSLSLKAGEVLWNHKIYTVNIGDFELKGDIFACAVINATEDIRIGDEVVVVCNDAVRAVGRAKMNFTDMKESKNGLAVKVRHKRKKS